MSKLSDLGGYSVSAHNVPRIGNSGTRRGQAVIVRTKSNRIQICTFNTRGPFLEKDEANCVFIDNA